MKIVKEAIVDDKLLVVCESEVVWLKVLGWYVVHLLQAGGGGTTVGGCHVWGTRFLWVIFVHLIHRQGMKKLCRAGGLVSSFKSFTRLFGNSCGGFLGLTLEVILDEKLQILDSRG